MRGPGPFLEFNAAESMIVRCAQGWGGGAQLARWTLLWETCGTEGNPVEHKLYVVCKGDTDTSEVKQGCRVFHLVMTRGAHPPPAGHTRLSRVTPTAGGGRLRVSLVACTDTGSVGLETHPESCDI